MLKKASLVLRIALNTLRAILRPCLRKFAQLIVKLRQKSHYGPRRLAFYLERDYGTRLSVYGIYRVLVCSTGAMGKNIDVVIGKRFKKHGMSWTTEGANNLLKLRTLCYNKNDWEAFWRKQPSCGGEFSPN